MKSNTSNIYTVCHFKFSLPLKMFPFDHLKSKAPPNCFVTFTVRDLKPETCM